MMLEKQVTGSLEEPQIPERGGAFYSLVPGHFQHECDVFENCSEWNMEEIKSPIMIHMRKKW